jgi:hypothetical protein
MCGHLTCWADARGARPKAASMHSPDHSSKGTPSGLPRHPQMRDTRPPTAGRSRGSGSVSFPLRGAFHLSLTVLVPYRWPRVFSLGGWSPLLPTGCLVSRGTQAPDPPRPPPLVPTGLSPSLVGRPRPFGSARWVCSYAVAPPCGGARSGPTTPPGPRCRDPDGLGCSRFARHYSGNLA